MISLTLYCLRGGVIVFLSEGTSQIHLIFDPLNEFYSKKILSIFNLIVGVFWGYKGGLSVKGGLGGGVSPNPPDFEGKKG